MQVTYGLLGPFHHGRGYQELVTPPDPDAGGYFEYAVGGDAWVRLIACAFTVHVAGPGDERFVTVKYSGPEGLAWAADGSGVTLNGVGDPQQFYGSNQRGDSEWQEPGPVFFPLWGGFMPPGSRITIAIGNQEFDDALASIALLLEKFETNESGYLTGGMDHETFAGWLERHEG